MKSLMTKILFLTGCILYLVLLGNTQGAPAGATGAPGEDTCGRSGCHATVPNSGNASISLQLDNGATAYVPGETHTLRVSIESPQSAARNGFSMLALNGQNNSTGEWIIAGEYLQTISAANGRDYVTHSEDGSILTFWEFDWKAPSSNIGAIKFYLAVNDANDDGERTGDNIYTSVITYNAQIASSLKAIASLENISVFPNPIETQLNIKIDLTKATNIRGTLVNSVGQSITSLFQQDLPVGDSNLSMPFPLDLPVGPYFLKLEDLEGGVKSVALLKK